MADDEGTPSPALANGSGESEPASSAAAAAAASPLENGHGKGAEANGNSSALRQRPQRQRRSSSVSSGASVATMTGALLETAKHVEERVTQTLLQAWDELPAWRRDNVYIRSGYRPTSNSYRASLASLGYLHNESVNIWTHLLGAVAFSAAGLYLYQTVAPRYPSASSADLLVMSCFFAGALLCLSMSATYHAFSNHSPEVARRSNKLDYTGIVFLIVGSYVPALYYGFYCEPRLMALFLVTICALGAGCLAVSWFDRFRQPRWRPWRALVFVGLGVSGVGPVLYGIATQGYARLNERMGLTWVLAQGGLYILGAFLYAIRWPERVLPGTFDIWGSSHQIFHVLILVAIGVHLHGMAKAFDFHHGVMGAQC